MNDGVGVGVTPLRWTQSVPQQLLHEVERIPVAPDAGFVVQVPSGEIVGANALACQLLGLSWEALLGRTSVDPRWAAVSELGNPLPGAEHPAMRTLADGIPVRGFLMGVLIPPEAHAPSTGGLTRWIEINTEPLHTGGTQDSTTGPPDAVAVTFTDQSTSDRARRASDTLLMSFRILGDAAPGVVLRTDTQAVVLQANSGAGVEPRLIQGGSLADWIHPDERVDFGAFWRGMVADGTRPANLECRWRDARGDYRWTIMHGNPIVDEAGEVCGVVVGLQDVHDIKQTRTRLQETAEQLDRQRVLAELAINGTSLATWDWQITTGEATFNERWAEIIGYTLAELGPTSLETWKAHAHPGDVVRAQEVLKLAMDGVLPHYEIEMRRRHRNGHWVWVRDYGGVTERDAEGRAIRMSGVHEDISSRMRALEVLAASEQHYRLLAQNMSDAVWLVSGDGRVKWVSMSTASLLGQSSEGVVGQRFVALVHPEDRRQAQDLLIHHAGRGASSDRSRVRECRLRQCDGTYRSLAISAGPAEEGADVVLSLHDIQGEVEAREALQRAVMQDSLTGLVTREGVASRIRSAVGNLSESWRPEGRDGVGVMVVGVDGLTAVNDALTHAAGDRVIREVGQRLRTRLGSRGCLGRGSGDEFLVVVEQARSDSELADLSEQLRLAVKEPVDLGTQEVYPTVSIGIVMAGVGADPDEVLRDAATAMRRAKAQGPDRSAFLAPDAARVAQHQLRLETQIRLGLEAGEFVPWFQPIVGLETEHIVGFEALVRWQRAADHIIGPGEFLPIAEGSALIVDLDRSMLRQSVAFLAKIRDDLTVAVNVSGRTMGDPQYFACVEATLAEFGVDPRRLHLEVTETALPGINDTTLRLVERLADVGVRWYADDFGTGYSSIAVLRDLPIRGIKLDRSFTHQLGRGDATSEQLARAIAGLAEELGLDAVAEGVETSEEASVLLGQGWRHGQGWLYGRPAPDPVPPV